MRPLILISAGCQPGKYSARRTVSTLYGEVIAQAGGIPAVYTGGNPESLAQPFSGLLLSGGGDVEPKRYGASRLPTDDVDEARDAEEFALIEAFLRQKKPVFGICRGIQVLNVYFGGTLRQDIPHHAEGTRHWVNAVQGTVFHRLCGERFVTNSWHHQAVGKLAPGLRAAAAAEDGTIEAVQHEILPVFAVQWHPERMIPNLCADVETDHLCLFRQFVQDSRAAGAPGTADVRGNWSDTV